MLEILKSLLAQNLTNLICVSADEYFSAFIHALIQAFSVLSKAVEEQTIAIYTYFHVFYAKTNRDGLMYSTGSPILKNVMTQKYLVY